MAITLRTVKGSALTHVELDDNFTDLSGRIIDSAGIASIARSVALDSAEAFQLLLDSSEIINLIDSNYITQYALNTNAVTSLINSDYIAQYSVDSSEVINLIDSDYVNLRPPSYTTHYEDEVKGTIDSAYVLLKAKEFTTQSQVSSLIDSALLLESYIDSADALNLIDSTHVKSYINEEYITALQFRGFIDSGDALNLIDSNYITTYQDYSFESITDKPTTLAGYGITDNIIDSAIIVNLIDSVVDSAFVSLHQDFNYSSLINPPTILSNADVIDLIVDNSIDSDLAVQLVDSDYVQLRQTNRITPGTLEYNFTITANGVDHYVFVDSGNTFFPSAENDPTLYLRRGEKYLFTNTTGAHPMEIQDSDGNAYEIGVTNNRDNDNSGIVTLTPSMSAPPRLKYQCTSHAAMGGIINIV
jgi:hypothetical protein